MSLEVGCDKRKNCMGIKLRDRELKNLQSYISHQKSIQNINFSSFLLDVPLPELLKQNDAIHILYSVTT
jgi:hypothetical protein